MSSGESICRHCGQHIKMVQALGACGEWYWIHIVPDRDVLCPGNLTSACPMTGVVFVTGERRVEGRSESRGRVGRRVGGVGEPEGGGLQK